jgi:hypothetical protein
MSQKVVWANSGYEIYLFGVNLRSFEGSNWMKVTAGALASVLAHELGHALYLESRGKDWSLEVSSSGLGISTFDDLSDKEYRHFGRAGFLLQTGIGAILASFEKTRESDFTRGWVSLNAIQTWSYRSREHSAGDDFAMIDKGHGNGDSELLTFSLTSLFNFYRVSYPAYKAFLAREKLSGSQTGSLDQDLKVQFNYDWDKLTSAAKNSRKGLGQKGRTQLTDVYRKGLWASQSEAKGRRILNANNNGFKLSSIPNVIFEGSL